jgi:speckle-type POZ protein
MASETTGNPKMIVPYEWILENVEVEPMTIASKMILFRGEKVFRVGLKNHTKSPILFFMAIDLGKIGMKVEDVKYGIQGSGSSPATMKEMTKKDIGDEGSLQLFTIDLAEKVSGNCTFSFRICINGSVPSYSYRLTDRLDKDQLWALCAAPTVKDQQNLADVEFIVKDKTFPAHKAILAARSPVFADEFEKVQLDVPQQIRIDGVEPSTVENFLHFIYTGESIGTLADEELLKLADHYQLKTLASLCQLALKKIDALQMARVKKHLNSKDEELSSSKIM